MMYEKSTYQEVLDDIAALKNFRASKKKSDTSESISPEKKEKAQQLPILRIQLNPSNILFVNRTTASSYSEKVSLFETSVFSQFPDSPVTQALRAQSSDKKKAQYAYRCWTREHGDSTSFTEEQMLQNIREKGVEKGYEGVPWMAAGVPQYYFFFQNIMRRGTCSYMLIYQNEHFQYPVAAWTQHEKGHVEYEAPPWDSADTSLPRLSELVVGLIVVEWAK